MDELAITGGPPAAADLDVPDWPRVTTRSREYVIDALDSGTWCRIGDGRWVERFEGAFADYHDADDGIAVANGTVALELALRAVGVEPGDEVIVPAYTFIATASAVASIGAVPRFADVDPATGTIDADSIADAASEDAVCVIGVHFGGYPFDFDAVLPVVEERELSLVEDCAHAQGTEWRGRKVGAIGDAGAFSFQESKALAGGEGGIVLTDDDEIAAQAEMIHDIGRAPEAPAYEHDSLASNYRLSELHGALLSAQFEAFPDEAETREANGALLAEELAAVDGVSTPPDDERITCRGYYYFAFTYDPDGFAGATRRQFLAALDAEGVPAGTAYGPPLNAQRAFDRERVRSFVPPGTAVPAYESRDLPGAEAFAERIVTLPHPVLLADEDAVRAVADAVKKLEANAEAVAAIDVGGEGTSAR